MILRVPENFKGSFVLPTLGKAFWSNMQVVVSGNDLYAPDIKAAIKNKMLVPFIKGEYDEYSDTNHEVLIVNRTDKKLVLGKIVLNPGAALPVSREISESAIIQGAESDDLISIISDDKSYKHTKLDKDEDDEEEFEEEVEVDEEEEFEEEFEEEDEEVEEEVEDKVEVEKKVETIEPVEDKLEEQETVAQFWDIREKTLKEAERVNKVSEVVEVEEEPEVEEPEVKENKKTKKKTSKKKKVAKNKKGIENKKKNVKVIEPVGTIREKQNIAIELDSRGNPIEKPSDMLNHLIDEVAGDISFVDKEQKKEQAEQRGIDTNNWEFD